MQLQSIQSRFVGGGEASNCYYEQDVPLGPGSQAYHNEAQPTHFNAISRHVTEYFQIIAWRRDASSFRNRAHL